MLFRILLALLLASLSACAQEEGPVQAESLFGGGIKNHEVEAEAAEIPCGDAIAITVSPNFSLQTKWFVFGSDQLAGTDLIPSFGHLRLKVASGCPLVVRFGAPEFDTEVIFSFEGLLAVNEKVHRDLLTVVIPKSKDSALTFRNPTTAEAKAFAAAHPPQASNAE